MMTLAKDKRAPVKNDLLHVRFGSTGTHAVNTPTNIQVWGPLPDIAMRHDSVGPEAQSPCLAATGHRTVQGVR
jgi:hypothetical protein